MKKLWCVLLLAPLMALAQGPFDGTWKGEVASAQFEDKPDSYLLQNGMYQCSTCIPKVSIKADGQAHKVAGSPYYDALMVKPVDDSTVQITRMKAGKKAREQTMKVAEDGNSLTAEWTDYTEDSPQPMNFKMMFRRASAAPSGAHKISGSWKADKFESISDNATTMTIKTTGDEVNVTTPTGFSYTAKLDGKDYPVKGDPGTTSVSLRKIDANTIEETGKRNGKVIGISRMTVQPDGKTMKVEYQDKLRGDSMSYMANKQ